MTTGIDPGGSVACCRWSQGPSTQDRGSNIRDHHYMSLVGLDCMKGKQKYGMIPACAPPKHGKPLNSRHLQGGTTLGLSIGTTGMDQVRIRLTYILVEDMIWKHICRMCVCQTKGNEITGSAEDTASGALIQTSTESCVVSLPPCWHSSSTL